MTWDWRKKLFVEPQRIASVDTSPTTSLELYDRVVVVVESRVRSTMDAETIQSSVERQTGRVCEIVWVDSLPGMGPWDSLPPLAIPKLEPKDLVATFGGREKPSKHPSKTSRLPAFVKAYQKAERLDQRDPRGRGRKR